MSELLDKGNEDLDIEVWESRIDLLTVDQLFDLNKLVAERIRLLKDVENATAKARFRVGDYVSFTDKNKQHQFGRIDKINPKTIHVDSGNDSYWKIAPALLKKERPPAEPSAHPFNQPGRMRQSDWVFGIAELQVTIDDAPPGYEPEVIICIDGTGLIRHSEMVSYGDRAKDIVTAFRKTVDNPMAGVVGPPQTLRIEDLLTANLLSPLYPEIELVIAQVPEIYQIAENFPGNSANSDDPAFDYKSAPNDIDEAASPYETVGAPLAMPNGYLQPELDAAVISDFFDTAAAWYQVRKDSRFFQSCACIGVTINQFDIKDQVLYFLPDVVSDPGFVLFDSLNDFDEWRLALSTVGERIEPENIERIPPISSLSFVEKAAVSKQMHIEVSDNCWRLPEANVYPVIAILEDIMTSLEPDKWDIQCFEVLCSGLVALMSDTRVFCNGLRTGESVAQTYSVSYSGGKAEVCFSQPVLPAGKTRESLNLAEELALLDRMDQKCVALQQKQLSYTLEKLYVTSDEYKQRKNTLDTQKLLIDLSLDHYGVSVVSLTQFELEEILFRFLARKALAPVDCYDDMFEDIRAFFLFLSNHFAVVSARYLVVYLDADIKKRFLKQLTDQSYVHAKGNLEVAGYTESGFDSDWGFPSASPPKVLNAAQKKDKKNKRKQRKNARKNNRR